MQCLRYLIDKAILFEEIPSHLYQVARCSKFGKSKYERIYSLYALFSNPLVYTSIWLSSGISTSKQLAAARSALLREHVSNTHLR